MERHELPAAGPAVVTAADLVAGHVTLDISCPDRVYLNGYVAKLQTPGGVVYFFRDHRGKPIISPALFEPIGEKFRRDIKDWALANGIPLIRFRGGERKADVMAPYLDAAAATGRSQVALQQICGRFGPGTVQVWFERWMARIPLPLSGVDRDAGYWRELSMRQVETSRTLVFNQDVHARAFFEALLCENMDLGRPGLWVSTGSVFPALSTATYLMVVVCCSRIGVRYVGLAVVGWNRRWCSRRSALRPRRCRWTTS